MTHSCRCGALIRWALAYCFDCNAALRKSKRLKGWWLPARGDA